PTVASAGHEQVTGRGAVAPQSQGERRPAGDPIDSTRVVARQQDMGRVIAGHVLETGEEGIGGATDHGDEGQYLRQVLYRVLPSALLRAFLRNATHKLERRAKRHNRTTGCTS